MSAKYPFANRPRVIGACSALLANLVIAVPVSLSGGVSAPVIYLVLWLIMSLFLVLFVRSLVPRESRRQLISAFLITYPIFGLILSLVLLLSRPVVHVSF